MRLAPRYVLLLLLGMVALAALSPLGTPPESKRAAGHAAPRATTTDSSSTGHAGSAHAAPAGWNWVDSATDLEGIADDLHESTRERQVRVAALGFMRETVMGRQPRHITPSASLLRFRAWARTLPSITRQGTTYVNLEGDRDRATVDTSWELWTRGYTVPGEQAEPHVIGTGVELQLELRDGTWYVTDATYEREGLVAFRSPTVVRDGAVTVVADAADRDLAADIAGMATRAERGIVADWPGISRRGPVTIYLARSADASELIRHRPAEDHAAAWVNQESDVIMLADAADRGVDDAELVDLVWHELTHVVIAPVSEELPAILNEGFADYVGTEAATSLPLIYMNYASRAATVRSRPYPYARMLTGEHDDEFYAGVVNSEIGYHMGHATIAWIREQRGDRVLRRFMTVAGSDGGIVATRRVLHMSPTQLGRHAMDWVNANEIVE